MVIAPPGKASPVDAAAMVDQTSSALADEGSLFPEFAQASPRL
jgi:hypothetical protein